MDHLRHKGHKDTLAKPCAMKTTTASMSIHSFFLFRKRRLVPSIEVLGIPIIVIIIAIVTVP